jgi:GGDEF domain-containing protein
VAFIASTQAVATETGSRNALRASGGHQIVTGVSAGIAVAPADGETSDQLLKNADMALYRAKMCFSTSDQTASSKARRARLEGEANGARYSLAYFPYDTRASLG